MLLIHIKIQNKNSYKCKLHLVLFCFYTDSNTFACRGRFHIINIPLVFLFRSWHLLDFKHKPSHGRQRDTFRLSKTL